MRTLLLQKIVIILFQPTNSSILEIREISRPYAGIILSLSCENNSTTTDTVIIYRRQHRCRMQQNHSYSSASQCHQFPFEVSLFTVDEFVKFDEKLSVETK